MNEEPEKYMLYRACNDQYDHFAGFVTGQTPEEIRLKLQNTPYKPWGKTMIVNTEKKKPHIKTRRNPTCQK